MDDKFYEGYWDRLENQHDLHPANRIRYREILKSVNQHYSPNLKVLDIGCGSGALIKKLQFHFSSLTYTGTDISENAIALATNNVPNGTFFTNDFASEETILFKYRSAFDLAIASEVIEHVENDFLFLENIYSVLKSGGTLLLTTQSGPRFRMDREILGHIRHYDKKHLEALAIRAGFRVESSIQFGFPFQTLQKILVDKNFQRVKSTFYETEKLSFPYRMIMRILYLCMLPKICNRGPQLFLTLKK